jgi:RND family efflux transporter MFP subunit
MMPGPFLNQQAHDDNTSSTGRSGPLQESFIAQMPPSNPLQGNGVGKNNGPVQGWSGQVPGDPSPRFSLPVAIDTQVKPSYQQSAPVVPSPVVLPPVQGAISTKKPEASGNKQRGKGKQSKRGLIIASAVGVTLLLGAIVVASAVFASKSSSDVTLYKVGVGTVDSPISGGGIIFPRQQLDISYPSAERVIAVLIKAGDHITANQSLIQLDPSQLNAEVTQASNDLAAAQAYLNTVTASRNPLTIAQAQQAYNIAKNKYDALVAEAASPTLHHGTLVSPMNGVVTSVNVNAGEVFSANTPLLTIMDESTVIVHVKIPLSDLGQVQSGQTAMVIPSALPKLNLVGKVISIVPKADPQTDTFEVWIEVPNSDMTLLPGMSAFVRIQGQGGKVGGRDESGPYALPRLAVLYAENDPTVFVMRGEQAYVQRVHIVGRSVEIIYVDSGVHAGDRIVLVGLDTVHNGQKVRVSHIEG